MIKLGKGNTAFGLPGTFFVFLTAIAISGLGDSFRVIALNLWFYAETSDKEATRLILLLLGVVPGLIFAPLAGAIADRFDLRTTFLWTMIVRGALSIGLAGAAWLVGPGQIAYVLLVAAAIASVFFASSAFVFVPRLLERDLLPRANSIVEATSWTLGAVGPALAAIVFGLWGPTASFLVDAVTFFIAAAFFAALVRKEKQPKSPLGIFESMRNAYNESGKLFKGIPAAVRHLARNRFALGMLVSSYGVTFTAGVNSFSLVFFIDDELGLPIEALGFVLSWNGIIAVVAALTVGVFTRRSKNMKVMFLSCLGLLAVSQFVMGSAPNITLLAVGVAISAFVNAPYNIAVTTLFQTSIDDEFLGRVEGLDTTAENSIQIVVYLAAAAVVAAIGPRIAIIGAGVIAVLLLIAGSVLMRHSNSSREDVLQETPV